MRFDLALFEGLARGYLSGAEALLTEAELRALPLAGPLLTVMNALRFLTDYLEGDRYFRIQREGHNLVRVRAQQRLAELMIESSAAMREAVASAARR